MFQIRLTILVQHAYYVNVTLEVHI